MNIDQWRSGAMRLYALDADAYQPAGHASAHHGAQPVRVRDTALRPDTALGSALADGLSR